MHCYEIFKFSYLYLSCIGRFNYWTGWRTFTLYIRQNHHGKAFNFYNNIPTTPFHPSLSFSLSLALSSSLSHTTPIPLFFSFPISISLYHLLPLVLSFFLHHFPSVDSSLPPPEKNRNILLPRFSILTIYVTNSSACASSIFETSKRLKKPKNNGIHEIMGIEAVFQKSKTHMH